MADSEWEIVSSAPEDDEWEVQRSGPPNLAGRLWNGSPGLLRPGSDVAADLGTAGLQIGGAMLAPEIAGPLKALPYVGKLAPGVAEGGAGILKTLLSYLKTGAWAAAGDTAGTEAAEQLDLKPDTTLGEKMPRFLANTVLGGGMGYGADLATRGTNRLGYDAATAATDDAVQMAKGFAERKGALPSDPLPEKVALANSRASTFDQSAAAELGANAGDNAYEVAMGDRLRKAMPEIADTGVLQAKTPEDMLILAKNAERGVNALRETKLASIGNKITIAPADLSDSFQALNDRVVQLAKNNASEPLANSIKDTAQKFLGDLNRVPQVTARDAVEMAQNLNEARRVLGQEFNAAKQAGTIRGDVASLGEMEASIEALSELGNGLTKAVDDKLGEPFFSGLNQRQSALKALTESTEKFQRGIYQGQATRPASRLVKTASEQGGSPTSFGNDLINSGPKVAMLKKLWNSMTGAQETSPMLTNALRVESQGPAAMENIQALRQLQANPAQLQPAPGGPLGGRLPQSLISAATGGQAIMGAMPAQAQLPPLPRSSAILQNPQQLMQMAAMASGNNPEVMQDVMAVLKEPNQNKRDMAMMELTRMLPQIFEPSPYRSLWNGRIADPVEQRMYVDDLKSKHRQGQVDANYLAKSVSSINADGTVLPPPPPLPASKPQPVSTQGLERREYSY